ncbi:MAG: NUDIX domain-containing protein [Ignavibacteriales bacterium]|nr:NUDIX domain-containing protein [Ignavibacteriales bacterium]
MKKISCGILIYRIELKKLKLFLVHPGGPFFKNKDDGHWGIPKGEVHDGEDYLICALREVKEEIGIDFNGREFLPLGSIIQKNGKVVHAWACEENSDFKVDNSGSMVELQWPPLFGKKIRFPEIDQAQFFSVQDARKKIKAAQIKLIERLELHLQNLGLLE